MVRGLKPVDRVPDVDLFAEVSEDCLTIKRALDRDRCRRLGKRQPGKIPPLLVALRSGENAAHLLKCAKLLKDSSAAMI